MKFSRRDFLKRSALFLTGVALCPKQVFSVDSAARDLQMLILGDSIMWGQGLLEQQKFWYLTKEWLREQTGKNVVPHLEAHSGATIFWRGDQKYPLDRLTTFNGELNISTPTIEQQVENAVKYYESSSVKPPDVDLILVNGGINDLGAFNLINPFKNKRWIEKKARQYCGEDMFALLEKISAAFRNARIIVTGYYPVVSLETSQEKLCGIINALVREKIINRIRRFFGLGDSRADYCAFNSVRQRVRELIAELSILSETWQSQTNIYLRQAVERINKNHPLTAGGDTRRAVFVAAPFGAKNAYAASETYLWEVEEGGKVFSKYKSNDNFFALRETVCECRHIMLKGFGKDACYIAGTAHPNIKGAQKYAEAIQREFKEILPLTGWLG
jgi:hypothetical protein